MANTDVQEEASLLTFYHAIEKGAYLGTLAEPAVNASDRDEELYKALKTVYPSMPQRWYLAFIKQGIVLVEWLKKGNGVIIPNNDYKYGRFGSTSVAGIPRGSYSVFGDFLYNSLTKEQKKLFGGKKDSWNPFDVFIVKKRDERELIKEIHDSCCFQPYDRIAPDVEAAAEMEMVSLNQYLAYMTNEKIFVGISLKETDFGDPKVTETNLRQSFDHIHHSCGMITSPLKMDMKVVTSKTVRGKEKLGLNFLTNSLTMQAQFNIGNVLKKYKYESKISSRENHATEPRDLVEGARGGFVPAAARNGAVPAPKMAKIVEQYSGQKMNKDIPMNGNFSDTEKSNWVTLLTQIKGNGKHNTTADLGKFDIHLNRQADKWWSNMTVKDYMDKVVELDNEFKNKRDKFPTALRNKLRAARYILMFQKAADETPSKLDNLIAEVYFASSKVNISKDDLSGPFIKIQ